MRLDSRQLLAAVGLALIAGYVVAVGHLMENTGYDLWGAAVIGPLLVLVSVPALSAVARNSGESWLFPLLVTALVIKLLASLARYWTAFVLYDGSADAGRYHNAGSRIADSYRAGDYDVELAGGAGTQFIELVTGVLYTGTGATRLGGFLVFSWIGFWGLLLAFLAFRLAVPAGHQQRYALMVFFLPSCLFWPSSIGKEAWMTFGLGLCFYGAARLLSHRPGGVAVLLLGLATTGVVRPHVTLLVCLALVAAYAVRPSRRVTVLTPALKVGGLVLVAGVAVVALFQAADFLGIEEISREGFEGALDDAQERTDQGGSAFGGAALTSPLGLPLAFVTVLFRPFPFEVDSVQALLASAEGVLLMYLTWRFRSSIRQVPRLLRRTPFVTFCLVYVLGYVAIFAGFSNFGILVRQRTLALPAFLVLLALPVAKRALTPSDPQRREAVPAP